MRRTFHGQCRRVHWPTGFLGGLGDKVFCAIKLAVIVCIEQRAEVPVLAAAQDRLDLTGIGSDDFSQRNERRSRGLSDDWGWPFEEAGGYLIGGWNFCHGG
jgi:hypothetical protein